MKVFHCDHCGQLVFFENTQCTNCGRLLAYLPDLNAMASCEQQPDGTWVSPWPMARGRSYRLCQNYREQAVCNWAIPASDPNPLCPSCRLTQIIPTLSQPGAVSGWRKLEAAKRRIVYGLARLGLVLKSKIEDPVGGLAFQFLTDGGSTGGETALTGHNDGVITINIAEADDAERERRRVQFGEPYRTVLGHFRHEVGHYCWFRLIEHGPRLEAFRAQFGDERADYGQALKHYYEQGGAPADWQLRYVSAYAAAHPWEDWAETWAHYLHITDTLETAAECGMSLQPQHPHDPRLDRGWSDGEGAFDQLIDEWFPVTYLLNSLNRGLGMPDGYPFVLSGTAIEKLRFVHDTILDVRQAAGEEAGHGSEPLPKPPDVPALDQLSERAVTQ